MPPTYYRGCWHVVSRGFLVRYRLPSSLLIGLYIPKYFFTHAASLHQGSPHCAIFPTAASRRSLGRVSVPMWPSALSGRLPIVALVGRYPANWLIGRGSIVHRPKECKHPWAFRTVSCNTVRICGISSRFRLLSPCVRQVTHALLTRPPLTRSSLGFGTCPFDLHVLGTPPAFILSQDQTLMFLLVRESFLSLRFSLDQKASGFL